MDFFATNWTHNNQHFASLADAISYARRFGAAAVVYGRAGNVLWLPACDDVHPSASRIGGLMQS